MLERKANKFIQLILWSVREDEIVLGSLKHKKGVAHYATEPENYSLDLRSHAQKRVKQWDACFEKWGYAAIVLFPAFYLLELCLHGYHNNKYEIDARAYERVLVTERNLYLKYIVMSDTEYVNHCYQEG